MTARFSIAQPRPTRRARWRSLFKALSHAIQHHFIHRTVRYPPERTLLVRGILDASAHSRHVGGKEIRTPALEFYHLPTDVNELLRQSAELFGRTKKEISIHTTLPPETWAVEVDRPWPNSTSGPCRIWRSS